MENTSIETRRYTKQLHHLLLKIFHEVLADPIFKRVTINHLKINRTKTFATVYLDLVSVKNPRLVLMKLNKLNSLFKNSLSKYLNKYRIPVFKFVEDRVFESGQKVERLIFDGLNDA